jgi:hypothetical protein
MHAARESGCVGGVDEKQWENGYVNKIIVPGSIWSPLEFTYVFLFINTELIQ